MSSLDIVALTHNEQKNIKEFIQAAKLCQPSKIIIVDDNSTDDTVSIAKSCGAVVYKRALEGDFAAQRNFALEKSDADYIFFLDADEFVTQKLATTIKNKLSKNPSGAYAFWRKNIAFGQRVNHGPLAPDCVVRIFPKGSVQWEGRVHEKPVYSCEVIRLDDFVWHHTYKSWEQYLDKMNHYSTLSAQKMYTEGKKINVFKGFFVKPVYAFLKMFVLKKGFLDGATGLALCWFYSMYTLSKYVKLKTLYN